MQNVTINPIIRKDRVKDGLYPIYIRLIINRRKIDIRITHYIGLYDLQPNGQVKNSVFNCWAINQDILNVLNECNKIIVFHRSNGMNITVNSFNKYFRKKIDTSSLTAYIRTQSAEMGLCNNRLYAYTSLANKIQKHFPNLTLLDADYNFLLQLESVFIKKFNHAPNTVTSNMSKLKAILGHAYKQKLIQENPFIYYKLKGYTSNRMFLNKAEVLLIDKYRKDPTTTKPQQNICSIFLFLCYTGLRIGDFQKMQFEDIKNNGIELIQNKTGNRVFIPLSVPVMQFIDMDNKRFLFYKIADQKVNEGLKIVAKNAGITKPLTCHVARHTFATISLLLDIKLENISKILGHTKISTTMIYAKILDETNQKEMSKWDNF